MNIKNKQYELPLCRCGCGERVNKPENTYIQYHYRQNNEFNKQRRLDYQKHQMKLDKKARQQEDRILQYYFPKKRSLLLTIILLPFKIIFLCIWWPIKIVGLFLLTSFLMALAPFVYVLVVGLLQIFACIFAFGLAGLFLWLIEEFWKHHG
jgi:hypothetical protein